MPHPTPRQRRQWIDWYLAHGQDVTATCEHFGISRPTLYTWLARYRAAPTHPLRSQRLHTRRCPTWSKDELRIVCMVLGHFPTLGRGRLTRALNVFAATEWSPATVGRMLQKMQARCPICGGRDGRHVAFDMGIRTVRQDLSAALGDVLTPPGLRPLLTPEAASAIREAVAIMRNPQG